MNPVLALLGRRLRLGVIGGGPGSFIGPVHRTAARLDDRFEIGLTLIPHTWTHTTFHRRPVGSLVNVEVDVLAKYVERLCQPYLKRA